MATDQTKVRITTRLWSSEVEMAEAMTEGYEGTPIKPRFDPAYKFSNGRKFDERAHYEDPPNE